MEDGAKDEIYNEVNMICERVLSNKKSRFDTNKPKAVWVNRRNSNMYMFERSSVNSRENTA